jgi:AcrR family transcriptional regulator
MAKHTTQPRLPLSRDRVLGAAIALADGAGIEAITMRRLGQELGVEAMSLYNHVTNKDDLLDGMLDAVLAEYDVPSPGTDWRAAVQTIAVSANKTLRRHTWASTLMDSPRSVGEGQLRYMNSLLGWLRAGGFSAEQTHHAYHVIDGHILGYTRRQLNFPIAAADLRTVAEGFLETLPADQYPHLVEHVIGHIDGTFESGGGFEFALDLILDGLEKFRDAG